MKRTRRKKTWSKKMPGGGLRKGALKGWTKRKSPAQRKRVLERLIARAGYGTVVRRLVALQNLTRDAGTKRAVASDLRAIAPRRTRKPTKPPRSRNPRKRAPPRNPARHVKQRTRRASPAAPVWICAGPRRGSRVTWRLCRRPIGSVTFGPFSRAKARAILRRAGVMRVS
jgi:hypothetical protein